MDLSTEAMKHIEGMAKAGDAVKGSNVKYNAVIIPNDMEIQSTEHLQEFKNRYTGNFRTDSIASFAEYVNKQPEKICFVNSKEPTAEAIFDIGTIENPLHCLHKALIILSKTASYKALNRFSEDRQDQLDLAVFMEDWRFCITAIGDDGEDMDLNKAIMAIRSITIDTKNKTESEIRTFSVEKSVNELIEATSKGAPLPAWITFSCIPFHGLKQRDFPMRVQSSISRGGDITFNMKIQNLEKIIEAMVEEFRGLIAEAVDCKEIYTGSFNC